MLLKLNQLIFGLLLLNSTILIGQDLNNITDVSLTFTPDGGGTAITATAVDPDGDGPMPFQTTDINLLESTVYTLSIDVQNSIDNENSTSIINQNGDDFLFFFGFEDEAITSPAGDGNIDNRTDPMNYDDEDANGLPIGLNTSWETECAEVSSGGNFTVLLKNQEGIKTATSSSAMGTTEFDISWNININEDPNAPPCENEEEIITDVTLTFTPVDGGNVFTAAAQDPDGPGPFPLQIISNIQLLESTEYEMSITLFNSIEGEDVTQEIMEEDDEHMIFFEWTEDIFASPEGNGNTDNRNDPVNYNDFDFNDLPVGLSTNWTTNEAMSDGTFRIVLKHQPDIKSETSTVNDGGTDVDLTWNLSTLLTSLSNPSLYNDELNVFPNPVNNELSWTLENDNQATKDIFIFDQFGRLLLNAEQQEKSPIDVDFLQSGIYYLEIRSSEKSWIQRFVKTN